MTAEEILNRYCEHSSDMFDSPKDIVEYSNAVKAMNEYAEHHARLAFDACDKFHFDDVCGIMDINNKEYIKEKEEYLNKTFPID